MQLCLCAKLISFLHVLLQVEEIIDLDKCKKDFLTAAAIASEKEIGFTEQQKRNIRKVYEKYMFNLLSFDMYMSVKTLFAYGYHAMNNF